MLTRRELLAALPAVAAAAQQARTQNSFEFFTPAQARDVEAMAAEIIPTDDTPGATEAGVIYFIDRALSTVQRDMQPLYKAGLSELQAKTGVFADLSRQKRIETLKSIEQTEFFTAVRTHTIMGFLSNPEYGGNRNRTGWKLVGFTGAHAYAPPFGEYDREP